MAGGTQIVFLVNLLQDVNIVRPLVLLAASEFDVPIRILMSQGFVQRDKRRVWQRELDEIAAQSGSALSVYDSAWAAYALLQGRGGVIVAGSESNLAAHHETHDVFRTAPSSYLKITLQHGFECVGFLQNREHKRAHGENVGFGADVICGWCDASVLSSVTPAERAKLAVTGPSALVAVPERWRPPRSAAPLGGLVCENLHSVRLDVGDAKASFLESFAAFCDAVARQGESVSLRPHPSGRFMARNAFAPPANARLRDDPMYKLDLESFSYGISAPSSVVIDLVLAGVPVGVWQDPGSMIDASNYEGLVFVGEWQDWLALGRDAAMRRAMILERQARFLDAKRMLTDPAEVTRRFARLLAASARLVTRPRLGREAARLLCFAGKGGGRPQDTAFGPLLEDADAGRLALDLITEEELAGRFGSAAEDAARWLNGQLRSFDPDLVVFASLRGPFAPLLVEAAGAAAVPTVALADAGWSAGEDGLADAIGTIWCLDAAAAGALRQAGLGEKALSLGLAGEDDRRPAVAKLLTEAAARAAGRRGRGRQAGAAA